MPADIEIEEKIRELIEELLRREVKFQDFSLKLLLKEKRILKEIARQMSKHKGLVFIYQERQKRLIITTEENSFVFFERDH